MRRQHHAHAGANQAGQLAGERCLHRGMQMRLRLLDDQDVVGANQIPQIQHHRSQFGNHGRGTHQRQVGVPIGWTIGERWITGFGLLQPNGSRQEVLFQTTCQPVRHLLFSFAHPDKIIQEVGQYSGQHGHAGRTTQPGCRCALDQRADDHLVTVHHPGAIGRQVVRVANQGTDHRIAHDIQESVQQE